jgi:hypothetical protein
MQASAPFNASDSQRRVVGDGGAEGGRPSLIETLLARPRTKGWGLVKPSAPATTIGPSLRVLRNRERARRAKSVARAIFPPTAALVDAAGPHGRVPDGALPVRAGGFKPLRKRLPLAAPHARSGRLYRGARESAAEDAERRLRGARGSPRGAPAETLDAKHRRAVLHGLTQRQRAGRAARARRRRPVNRHAPERPRRDERPVAHPDRWRPPYACDGFGDPPALPRWGAAKAAEQR